jgi:S-DNA-T family DNA segregation ATPase FtsK/SpoIIIE
LRVQLQRGRRLLLGAAVVGLAAWSFTALVSPFATGATWAWGVLLGQLLGWARYAAPIGLALAGAGIIARSLSFELPTLNPPRVAGAVMILMALLASLHAAAGAVDFATSTEVANRSGGGGWLGGLVYGSLAAALGVGGAVVLLLAVLATGVILLFNLSLADAVEAGALTAWAWLSRVGESLWRPRRRPRPSLASRMGEAARPPVDPAPGTGSLRPAAPLSARGTQPASAASMAAPEAGEAPAGLISSRPVEPPVIWQLPDWSSILEPGREGLVDEELDRQRARLIVETLAAFGAPVKVVEIHRGPTITQFGVEPEFMETRPGKRTKVKVSKIAALADDLALALAAPSIRIEAPVPGKGFVGIEVPNVETSLVALRAVMESPAFRRHTSRLRLGLGMDVSGHAIAADLAAMPHLLIAGTTGSGKSVCINAIIACLLLQNTPDELRLVMVDPKRVELTTYNGIPHLLAPVVVELERVVPALRWISREMDERYRRFSKEGVRNLADYNERMRLAGQRTLPWLVVIVDELADLMMLAPDETERALTRLAQLARATGIHLVIATQRPSVDVVTGLIKANFPARIAFAVASSVDSRVILDQPGAERLLGRGDMLFQSPDAASPVRMQGAFVSEAELVQLISFWKSAASLSRPEGTTVGSSPISAEAVPAGVPLRQAPLWEMGEAEEDDGDALFEQAVEIVRSMRRASISLLQRRLRIGYTRAARLVDQLEERGIIGPAQHGSQAREVLDYGRMGPSP